MKRFSTFKEEEDILAQILKPCVSIFLHGSPEKLQV